ncbi:MAG TPA: hypothetical protein VJC03_08205, partial [bacterium]|nr:hypothetical protein [bacterium]
WLGWRRGTFSLGLIGYQLSRIPYTYYEAGTLVRDSFEDNENAYLLSFGYPLMEDEIYIGATSRIIRQEFTKVPARAMGWDIGLGAILRMSSRSFLGFSVDRGAKLVWDNGRSDQGKLTAKLGTSYRFMDTPRLKSMAAFEFLQKKEEPLSSSLGMEVSFGFFDKPKFMFESVSLRAGVSDYVLENRYGVRENMNADLKWSAGLGLRFNLSGQILQFDYSMNANILGNQQRLSLSWEL